MRNRVRSIVPWAFAVTVLAIASACGTKLPPPVVSAPHFPDFITPTLSPPDPRLTPLEVAHDAAWQFLQAGDLNQAEKNFQSVLKRSPAFYPSEAALGYVALARKDYSAALDHFDAVLKSRADT
jgi:TolA-binding protein